MAFTSTPRGARLTRRLCGHRLDAWGVPYGSDVHDTVTLIASELCSNAVRHGHVTGRDFEVRLTAASATGTVRIEVTDTRGERLPRLPAAATRCAVPDCNSRAHHCSKCSCFPASWPPSLTLLPRNKW
ncbi:ATP-binding protein [Streptomyces sp. NPDC048219]|uniref:ATP-binding protein n=1 Tax=unclassified Streptomyces TaxID=2593676 RepID=UPI0037195BB6